METEKQKEELLQKRYMVVNPFDGRFQRYYEIFAENDSDSTLFYWIEKHGDACGGISLTLPTNKMFLELKWWQARKLSDMPKHIKNMTYKGCHRHNDINKDEFVIHKVKEYTSSGFIDEGGRMCYWDTDYFQPSAKEEYDYYQIGHKAYGVYWDDWYKNEYNKGEKQ